LRDRVIDHSVAPRVTPGGERSARLTRESFNRSILQSPINHPIANRPILNQSLNL
jgi:hypothetical protein